MSRTETFCPVWVTRRKVREGLRTRTPIYASFLGGRLVVAGGDVAVLPPVVRSWMAEAKARAAMVQAFIFGWLRLSRFARLPRQQCGSSSLVTGNR